MDAKTLIDCINEAYIYDSQRGLLIHRNGHARAKAGSVAGSLNKNGHRYIRVKGVAHTLGRIVWLLETRELPESQVWMRDGNPMNTHFSNLRLSGQAPKDAKVGENGTKSLPPRDRLHQIFEYSEGEGGLINRIKRGTAVKGRRAGVIAGHGYRLITVDNVRYTEHRLVWWMLTGEDPSVLDHIDRCRDNNRIENLRPATRSQNSANSPNRVSQLGIPGVRILRGREGNKRPYAAYLSHQGKQDHLGYYATPEEAFEVHKAAHIARYGEYSKYHIATNSGKEV